MTTRPQAPDKSGTFERILDFSIRHRWLVMLAVLAMTLVGAYSYKLLSIDAVPDITNVQVQINTEAKGYSPVEVEQRITFPIETVMAGLPKLEYTRSISRYGLSQVTVIFKDGTDIYFARQLVNERIQEVRDRLPAQAIPRMGPISTGLGEIVMWTVEADPNAKKADGTAYTSMDLREVQDWVIKPQLRTVKGVTEINSVGGYIKQFHVTPYSEKLLAYGLDLQDVIHALERNNLNVGAGYIERSGEQYLVRVPGQVTDTDAIAQITVGTHQGVPIRIKDVADILIGKELRNGAATQNGQEVVLGTAFLLVGENSHSVSKAVERKIGEIRPSLPEGVLINIAYNRSNLVNKVIDTVATNLLEGAVLVIVVLFLMLGNMRAALITAMVIPLAMLFTFSGMIANKVSANLMSLGALDFGIIVDGAIVIVENCYRRLGEERNRLGRQLSLDEKLTVVFDGTHEVRRALLYGQLIIMAVYIPVFSLSGVEGKMFHPMAYTVVIALLGAAILSITFIPAAIALFLQPEETTHQHTGFSWLQERYQHLLLSTLEAPAIALTITAAAIALSLLLATRLGSEFIPSLNEGDIAMHALRIPGTSLSTAIEMQNALERTVKEFPEVDRVFSKIGTAEIATDPVPPSVADTYIILKPQDQWTGSYRSKAELVNAMEQAVQKVPGNNYEFTQPIQMRFNELLSGVRADVAIKVFGDDMDVLVANGKQIEQLLKTVSGAADVKAEQLTGLPVLTITPDRSKIARYGIMMADVQDAISTAIGGRGAGLVFEGDRRFEIQVRMPESVRNELEAIKRIPIKVSSNETAFITLAEIASVEVVQGPNQVGRENGKRRMVVTANVRNRDIGSFVSEAQSVVRDNIKLPTGYWISWGGQFEQLTSATQRLYIAVPAALLIVLILLYALFGNFRDGLIVFSGVPFALTGGVLALWLRDLPFSISAGVGFIALSGVAVLNGLVMVTFIRTLWNEGRTLKEAIIEGAIYRFRPVVMTALVAAIGFLPMALATSTGAEVQRPLATVVIGGIVSSSLLTLLILPLLYLYYFRQTERIRRT
ncbi:efflux RND transporter permease subunit [Methylobacillus sp.]|uniref:efflux RND transporter permease subunit n=1 Tax=Methylobacillus sp. TaxID=56818 RepID=UPI002FE03DB7